MNTPLFLAFIGFLLVNLLVGLYKGRHVQTMKDYALANRSMGTGTLIITIIATFIGCRYVTNALISEQDATKGLSNAFWVSVFMVGYSLLLGRVVFPRLLRFRHCYTLGDIMGQHYGPKAQLFTGVVSAFVSLVMIAAQFIALAGLVTLIGIQRHWIILLVGGAVILYTFTGGIRAVATTDVLQFIFVIGSFSFIVYRIFGRTVTITGEGKAEEICIDCVGKFLEALVKKVKTIPNSQHLSLFPKKNFWTVFWGSTTLCIQFFSPPIINRVLAARNRPQVRQAFTGFACLFLLFRLLIVFIGFGFLLTFGSGKIKEDQVFDQIQQCFFGGASIGVKILLMCTLLSVVMSTADSHLNALVVVVVRDICQYKTPKKEAGAEELKHVKKIALVAGMVSIVLAYLFVYYFKSWASTVAFFGRMLLSCLIVLVFGAAFRIKGNHKTFFYTAGLFLGLLTLASTLLYMDKFPFILNTAEIMKLKFRRKLYYVVCPLILLTGGLFFVIHKMVYGRLTWEEPEVKGAPVRQMGGIKEKWRMIFSNPLVWAKDTFARYGNEPTAVGLFISLSSIARITTAPRFHEAHTMIFTIVNMVALAFCVSLMLHVMWPRSCKDYFPLFYYGALVYTLPFIHILLFLYQPMSMLLLIQLAIAMALLHLLVDWRSYCFFTLIGGGAAAIIYWLTRIQGGNSAIPEKVTTTGYDMIWLALVTLISIAGLGFLFSSRQEQINTHRLIRTKTYTAGFGHDLLNLYQCPQSTIDHVQHAYKQDKKELIKEEEEWGHMARYMEECATQAKAFKKLVKFDYIPQSEMKIGSMKALVKKAYSLIPSFRQEGVRIKVSDDFDVEVFPPFVNNIILNLVKNAQKHGNADSVVLSWDAATRRLYVKDNGCGISSDAALKISDLYTTSAQDGTGDGIGLAFVFMVVEDIFKAEIDFESSEEGTTFWIEFPPVKSAS